MNEDFVEAFEAQLADKGNFYIIGILVGLSAQNASSHDLKRESWVYYNGSEMLGDFQTFFFSIRKNEDWFGNTCNSKPLHKPFAQSLRFL